jgi:hypothetical protein
MRARSTGPAEAGGVSAKEITRSWKNGMCCRGSVLHAAPRCHAYCGFRPTRRRIGGHLRSSAAKNTAKSCGVLIFAS